ncbi:MAG: FAD-dependent thymidylate synthase [Bacteroidetes bacterium]|nr:FAD-dependent thymidylate synthase [Rhodothermia bacterium]MCS7154399.1 FAD-dependent thymidylate synthase [Bacteroidota bacterium]MCX7907644.1 FAD-dependent thymidylate synthase [Bacteroidota bacterium]MDW8137773.1 FAD-dependent thymidylate synthase [Bacteroidota bacterium]MDW8286376.1 FAD-dependent thymidylate synthase [Bacteroidota bacterium]
MRPEDRELLKPYVTNLEGPVFALRNLPEEVIAVLFAYYSRSPHGLRENLLKLLREQDLAFLGAQPGPPEDSDGLEALQERARAFHEKWVIGYGHASVAEHAVVHLAVEDVSILASKAVEDARLASFTEKSTRYVVFNPERFYALSEHRREPWYGAYRDVARELLETYHALMPHVLERLRAEIPRAPDQSERAYEAALRAQACDLLRYLLPAAALTNLGMTINARSLEHLLRKLFSHPLAEVRELAGRIKAEALKVVPTLVKYADYNPYRAQTPARVAACATRLLGRPEPEPARPVVLVEYDPEAERKLLCAILYEQTRLPYEQLRRLVEGLEAGAQEEVLDAYLAGRGPHDEPMRALELVSYSFDVLLDFGAYRDLQRHRMATQLVQPFGPEHGYELPEPLSRWGLEAKLRGPIERAAQVYAQIAQTHPHEAAYVLPMAYRRRMLLTANLRELHHLIALRSGRQGHPAYRRIAQAMYQEIKRVHPLLARYIRVDLADYALARA